MGKKRAVAIKALILIVLVAVIVEWNRLPLQVNINCLHFVFIRNLPIRRIILLKSSCLLFVACTTLIGR